MGFPVAFDADVLYGIEVTDLFLTMATKQAFRPYWSAAILDEIRRNLRKRTDLDRTRIERRLNQMNRARPDALVEPPGELVRGMPVNRKDRHVLAVAVHVGAPTLVTNNLRHFPPEACSPYGVEATSADDFALAQIDLDMSTVVASIGAMAMRRQRYPKTPREVVAALSKRLPKAMARFEAYLAWSEGRGPDPR